jgi:hypothetical protein
MLERLFKDKKLLCLFDALIDSYFVENKPEKTGILLGNLTSQYFANYYLSPIDRHATASGEIVYMRYMDDMLLFGEKDGLLKMRDEISTLANEKLRLEIKNGGALHRTARGVNFLGCRVLPSGLRLSSQRKRRFFSNLKRCDEQFANGKLDELEYQQHLRALFSFLDKTKQHGNNGQRVILLPSKIGTKTNGAFFCICRESSAASGVSRSPRGKCSHTAQPKTTART